MNPRIGINVDLVLLPANERRNDVAAETGVSNVSYSSIQELALSYQQPKE